MLSLSKDRLREIICGAYESGWGGCLELKNEYADQIMKQFDGMDCLGGSSMLTVAASPSLMSTTSTSSDPYSTFIPGYYSYFGETSPIETSWVNNPDQDTAF